MRPRRTAICSIIDTGWDLHLLEAGTDSLSVVDDLLRRGVEPGPELCEGLQLLELGVGELEVARDGPVRGALRRAADARHGLSHVHRGQDPQLEESRREIDLAVGDRDEVGRDVCRDVLRLGLDDRKGGEGAAAELGPQVGGSLEEPGVDVEDVPGEGLAPRGAPQKEGKARDRPARGFVRSS